MARGDASHIDAAVTAAKNAFNSGAWSRISPQERAAVMRRIAAAAGDAAEEFVELEMACNGATVLGGTTMAGDGFTKGFWVAPTILTGVRRDMRVAREEIFGPVLSVIAYDTDDEAVAVANDSDYGLAATIWSTDNARALAMAGRIEAGSVWINDAHGINCRLPFGGYKQSGLGRELGPDALDAYTEVKTVALDLSGGRPAKPYGLLLSHAEN